LEIDIEALISALPRKLSIFTRALKETGARPAEMWSQVDRCGLSKFYHYYQQP